MKRRDFIKKTTAAVGMTGLVGHGCAAKKQTVQHTGPGFDIHPFVKQHPEAVFIWKTDVESKRHTDDLRNAGNTLVKELIVKTLSGGYPLNTPVVMKPNWTCAHPKDGKPKFDALGITTDLNFVEGWFQGLKDIGPMKQYIRECACPQDWEAMGWPQMAERNGIDFQDLTSLDFWDLKKGDLNFIKIPDGVVFKEIAYMTPINTPGTFFVNMPKFKAHGMGITGAIKNIQGTTAKRFHQMCTRYDQARTRGGKQYSKFYKKDFEKNIEKQHARHLKEGIPRWDRPGANGGIWMEQWSNRVLDTLSVTDAAIHIVEGVYSQDGDGFGRGPHEKLGPDNVTSRDYMSNVCLFGTDPFRVDIIAHWLGGHEPGNFGLFHIGIERGLSNVLDPHDIPVYIWDNGNATLTRLENIERTPLVTYYLQRDYNGQTEPRFHLVDEAFNYSAWKAGNRLSDCTPSIRQIGRDSRNRIVMEMTLPKREDVYVDVLNTKGEVLWRLMAEDLEQGVHQVVWDGFASPGLYSVYVKGMGWDAVNEVVTYS
ncbi:DUF362 domain-containing protein [Candidatus Latescibacterota bacterium]